MACACETTPSPSITLSQMRQKFTPHGQRTAKQPSTIVIGCWQHGRVQVRKLAICSVLTTTDPFSPIYTNRNIINIRGETIKKRIFTGRTCGRALNTRISSLYADFISSAV
jgi:hypothetical protein